MKGRLSVQGCPSVLPCLDEPVALDPALMGLRAEATTTETDKLSLTSFYWSKKHLQGKLEGH